MEVDTPRHLGGGPSHESSRYPAEDVYRDDCLALAGFTTVRVRLFGLPPVPDCFKIVRSGSMTIELMAAATDVINSLLAGRDPPLVTTCSPPLPRPVVAQRLSRIAESTHGDGLMFTWVGRRRCKAALFLREGGRLLFVQRK